MSLPPVELFTIAEARAFDRGQLADEARYPDAVIAEHRDRIAEDFAHICGVAFVPTEATVTVDGTGSDLLFVPHLRVQAVMQVAVRDRTAWVAWEADALADILVLPGGMLRREFLGAWPRGVQNIRVTYIHGYPTPPLAIKRAALKVLVSSAGAVSSNLPERATSFSDETGTFRLATPGLTPGSWYGIPEVDRVLQDYRERVPVLG